MKSVDLIGIVLQDGEKEQIKLKSGVSKIRKSIVIADASNCSINLTLWGDEMCRRFEKLNAG